MGRQCMDDLKLKIEEIEKKSDKNKSIVDTYVEILKVSLERNELDKLLSADPSYIYNSRGNEWLAGNRKWFGMSMPWPILENVMVSAIQRIYEETKSPEIERTFVSSIKNMLYSTPQQFFMAIVYFSCLSKTIQDANYYRLKFDFLGRTNGMVNIDEELRPFISSAIAERVDFLKNSSVYESNLFESCEYFSKRLVKSGLIGFMPEL